MAQAIANTTEKTNVIRDNIEVIILFGIMGLFFVIDVALFIASKLKF